MYQHIGDEANTAAQHVLRNWGHDQPLQQALSTVMKIVNEVQHVTQVYFK